MVCSALLTGHRPGLRLCSCTPLARPHSLTFTDSGVSVSTLYSGPALGVLTLPLLANALSACLVGTVQALVQLVLDSPLMLHDYRSGRENQMPVRCHRGVGAFFGQHGKIGFHDALSQLHVVGAVLHVNGAGDRAE